MTRLYALIASAIFAFSLFHSANINAGLGSYLNGAGTNNRALSGAGVAFAEDGMVMATNPAGLISLKEDGWLIGSIFLTAEQTANASEPAPGSAPSGGLVLAPGKRKAEPDVPAEIDGVFPIPFAAVHRRLNERSALGLVIYGNGGININYKAFDNPNCPPGTPQQGYLCFGDTGSDIAQLFISPTWAYTVNEHFRIGISPTVIYQTIEIDGFGIFAPASRDPNKLSNNGHSDSFGYGIKVGGDLDINDALRAGLTLQSKGHMQKHSEYAGLIANRGALDIAPYIQSGIAWQVKPSLTLLADFQRIYFSKINAYANPAKSPGRYGDSNGPGFGWEDLTVIKLGLHYRASDKTTLRLGYADVRRKPFGQDQVLNNLISTAVFDERINAGFSRAIAKGTLDVAINYVPRKHITGPNPSVPEQSITLTNTLFSIDIGWRQAF